MKKKEEKKRANQEKKQNHGEMRSVFLPPMAERTINLKQRHSPKQHTTHSSHIAHTSTLLVYMENVYMYVRRYTTIHQREQTEENSIYIIYLIGGGKRKRLIRLYLEQYRIAPQHTLTKPSQVRIFYYQTFGLTSKFHDQKLQVVPSFERH